jgi:putative redox protein
MSRQRRVTLEHDAGMRFQATTGTGRTLVFGDEPTANELSPVETVAAALAACAAMDVVSILEKKRQTWDAYRVDTVADQRDEYPQVYTRVDVTHVVTGSGTTETALRRAVELSASKYCPVNAMVSAGATEVHHHFELLDSAGASVASGEVTTTGPDRRPDVIH